jgi:formiminoglutamate deiminase
MQKIFAEQALLPDGWARQVEVQISSGCIKSLRSHSAPSAGSIRVNSLLPALANLHSHAFQRAMAGMTEYRHAQKDNFWTWRDLMYRFVSKLTPQQLESIAAMVYMQMLEAGYASVGEFHYVHHQVNGRSYANLAEMSERIFAASAISGIGLTHLPVLYSFGGANEQQLQASQLRFGNSLSRFIDLVEQAGKIAEATLPDDFRIGIAPHSLRAVSPALLTDAVDHFTTQPVHLHVAEQPGEVNEIQTWLGTRPVTWLLDNMPVNQRWCFIHATHMTDTESRSLAHSKAVVGLCPITESNLGDGAFNGPAYLHQHGHFGVGSDSNVRISVSQEFSTLEYSQRLRDKARNVLAVGDGSVGEFLYTQAATGGAQALARNAGTIAVGQLADLVAIDGDHPDLCALKACQLLDGWLFAADDRVVTDVWSAGRHQVEQGQHINREHIVKHYRDAVQTLMSS